MSYVIIGAVIINIACWMYGKYLFSESDKKFEERYYGNSRKNQEL